MCAEDPIASAVNKFTALLIFRVVLSAHECTEAPAASTKTRVVSTANKSIVLLVVRVLLSARKCQ